MPRERLQKEVLRDHLFDAEAIFQRVRAHVTPEVVALLKETRRARGPFAFGLDRQSEGKKALGKRDHTGHVGRVDLILQTAQRHGLYLPKPLDRPDRQDGDSPFLFDPNFWYVDGEEDRATGFSFAPEVRPRLWMAFATIRRINELDRDALPSALVLAEFSRFTRAHEWIAVWMNSIRKEGVDIIFPETGRVELVHFEIIGISVRAQSQHLTAYRDRALEVARKDQRVVFGKRPFGLYFSEDRRTVHTHPEEWPILWDVIHGIAGARFATLAAATRWVRETHGRTLSPSLIHKWLSGESTAMKLDRDQYVAYGYKHTPCVVKQRSGVLYDFSYTENCNKRYVREERSAEEQLPLPIDHAKHGTRPVPPSVLEAARARIEGAGRRAANPSQSQSIVPKGITRCAVCGARLWECHRDPGAIDRKFEGWSVRCEGYARRAYYQGLDRRETRNLFPEHRRFVRAGITVPLREALREALKQDFDPAALEAPAAVLDRRDALQKKRREVQAQIDALTENLLAVNLAAAPAIARAITDKAEALQSELSDCDREEQLLSAQLTQSGADTEAAVALREYCRTHLDTIGDDPISWRMIVRQFVQEVTIDLDAETWQATLKPLFLADLQFLGGVLRRNGDDEGGDGSELIHTSPTRWKEYSLALQPRVLVGHLQASGP